MNKLTIGILAHVDAGKTTLSEGLLYRCGCIRTLGRVDHGDAFLDTFALERERGITIFSKQAILPLEDMELTLLDTPGHADFSSEMERTLQVLDCAILVISGTDGVQGHTRTLWRLLQRYELPTFLFVNKMDLPGPGRTALMDELQRQLDGNCVDFGAAQSARWENVAMCDEETLAQYLSRGTVTDQETAQLIRRRRLFPCWFGSALRLEGVDALLDGLRQFAPRPAYPSEFGAKVYKIACDPQGNRLTFLKVTGGSLRVREPVTNRRAGLEEEQIWSEKADQLRLYSGAKYKAVNQVTAGSVCAVTGLTRTCPGQGLGIESTSAPPMLEPVLTYQLILEEGCDPHAAFLKLARLEEEDPQLHLVWNQQLGEIRLQLMGQVQREVLTRTIQERLGLAVTFGAGGIVYRETLAAPAEGAGHFEPLRHYAEVQLLLEPGERGSGLRFFSACSEEVLDRSWQRLILANLAQTRHVGVLVGAPITDLKLTLTAGRAHVKHTQGGDFRQAACRAVRQGLLRGTSVLLEPWYDFRLELPAESVGRAMSDIQRMCGTVSPPEETGDESVLTGSAPVECLWEYAAQVAAYTRGRGRLSCLPGGYRPCHNQDEVVARTGYDCQRDTLHPADSVFCVHGAGVTVPWDQVQDRLHTDSGLAPSQEEDPLPPPPRFDPPPQAGPSLEQDKQLQAIFERTYGPIKRRDFLPQTRPLPPAQSAPELRTIQPPAAGPEYLLVDGYNIIFAWDGLKAVARDNLDAARKLLMDLLSNYQGFRNCVVILVFDAYKVPRGVGEVSRYHNIHVVYTKEAETADAYIEKVTYQLGQQHRVRVASSDGAEQLIILGHGALRLSARAFQAEMEQVTGQIAATIAAHNRKNRPTPVRDALARAEERRDGGPVPPAGG